MGEETLAAFFLKVQAVEESFLLLIPTERSRALNILQSSLNKLLSFLGENSALCTSATISVGGDANGFSSSQQEGKGSLLPQTQCMDANSGQNDGQPFSGRTRGKRKNAGQGKKTARNAKKSNLKDNSSNTQGAVFAGNHACSAGKSIANADATHSVTNPRNGLKSKENFEDDFQELADFECPYDFGPGLAQGGNAPVSVAANHLAQCNPKYGQTMHDMPASAVCTSSESQFGEQVIGVSTSQSLNLSSCSVTHSHYGGAALPTVVPGVKPDCGMTQGHYVPIISAPSVVTGQDNTQYAGAVLDMSNTQGVQPCDPTDSLSQFAGVVLSAPQLTQSAAVCASSQYRSAVLSISAPDSYNGQYGQSILHGQNGGPVHSQFSDTVLDMSAAAGTSRQQCEATLSVSHSQYAGAVFEGASLAAQHSYRKTIFDGTQEQCQAVVAVNDPAQNSHAHLQHLQPPLVMSKWRTFECGCGEVLTHYRSIRPHLLSHGSNPLSCRFCRQVQVNEYAWSHHVCGGSEWKRTSVISREIFLCFECGKCVTSKNLLRLHTAAHHHKEIPHDVQITCRFCRLQFGTKRALFSHYRQHVGDRFVCRLCGAILNDFVQFASHMVCHDKQRRRCTCQQCGQTFTNHAQLSEHLKEHPGHFCDICQKNCPSKVALAKHQQKMHKAKFKAASSRSVKNLECGVCHKRFARVKELENHSLLHTGEKPIHCTLCSMSFRTRRALAKHRQTLGHCKRAGKSRERLHLCSECGKSYFRRQALQRHLRKHQTSKPFACQYCNFRCAERDNLRRHTARHFSTERNFICELCGAAFHAKKTLEIHHSYKHSTERRYKCPDCPMTFKARNALGRHAKIHSRTREHGCWCGAAFNRLYNLRRHMRLVHGSDDALPPIRKVEVLDQYQSVKQPISTRPAKKMIVKTRKVKADCMQKEQEAAAAAVVVVVGGDDDSGGVEGGDGGSGAMEREDAQVMSQVGMPLSATGPDQQQVSLQGVDTFTAMSAATSGGMVQPNVLHSLSHMPHHLTMEQSYAMVSATLHHHHHPHDSQQAVVATAAGTDPAITPHPHPFPHLSHPAIDYGQLQGLTTMVPYSTNITLTNAAPTTMADNTAQRQPEYYGAGSSGMEGLQQTTGDYTSPFSFIQNFLLPSVGVANLLDLAHASSSK